MNESQDIKNHLRDILGLNQPFQIIIPATVKAVNGNTCDVTPVNGEADILGVRLASEDDATDFICIPTVGSVVMVGMIDGEMGIVVMFGKIDSVKIRGDQYGGLIKIEKLVDKINALENLVNNILDTLKTTTIPLAPSGTYPFAPLYTTFNDITPVTSKGDLENPNIKHG
jgi:hypothetical protein